MTGFYALLLPFAAAVVAPWAGAAFGHRAGWLLALVPAVLFAGFAAMIPEIAQGTVVRGGFDWVPALDLRFSWSLDGLSLAFALMITGIGALILIYTSAYMKGHRSIGRFLGLLLAFMGAMQGLVLADSFATLFVFWELTSITSFLLIGFNETAQGARRAAFQALVVTGGGGLLLLAGLIVIWQVTGQAELSELPASAGALAASPLYLTALLLVLGGAFTKSAQVPFHVWLPDAMQAPTPVSAYLHSATMVKAGVYLLMRLNPVLGGTPQWHTILPVFGAATLAWGALQALAQRDLKLKLAYTTVASLGLLVMLVGVGTPTAIAAAALYLLAHSLFKGALFMVAGTIDKAAGHRDVTRLSGLRGTLPLTFAAAVLAALSMAGLPPLIGFLAKEETYAALGGPDPWSIALCVVAIAGNAVMVAIGLTVALRPFLGPVLGSERLQSEQPALVAGPLVLALAALAAGVGAMGLHRFVTNPLASAIAGAPVAISVTGVPHWSWPLALSVVTILAGLAIYYALDVIRARLNSALVPPPGSRSGFDCIVGGLLMLAAAVTGFVQGGRLDRYMLAVFAVLALVLLGPLWIFAQAPSMPSMQGLAATAGSPIGLAAWVAMGLTVTGVATVLAAKDRLTAIVALGIQGLAVALLFLLFSAPDLAFTQFMIEILSVVILALVMTRIRLQPSDRRPARDRVLTGLVAVACGAGLMLVMLSITQQPFDARLTRFFEAYARTVAHGRNVVNVIIVDFRGLDTLGEISVVMVAALSILALIGIRRDRAAGQG